MPTPHYDRLSALDATFLSIEDRDAHMHVGSVSRLDAKPFRTGAGGLDFERIEQALTQVIQTYPRLRQKVWWPSGAAPVWVDDPHFDPSFHFRRAALPSPSGDPEFRNLVSSILSGALDLGKPLWEAWIIEGLEQDRFGIVWKIHHCLADGVSVRDILTSYLGLQPTTDLAPIEPFVPRPMPTLGRLRFEETLRRLESTRQTARRLAEYVEESTVRSALADAASGLIECGANLLSTVSPTPLNGEVSRHRRFEWTSCSFETLRDVRKQTEAKVNDVVLTALTGALRRFLLSRGTDVDDLHFRVMIPVSMRSDRPSAPGGNVISNMIVPLPLYETDPRRRLRAVVAATTQAKASGQVRVADALLQAVDAFGMQFPRPLARIAARQLPANLVVTNIPGPPLPQYLLESELVDSYPVVPLSTGQGLGVALYSYNGSMHWGFNADRERIPDLAALTEAVDLEVAELHRAYSPIPIRSRPRLSALPGRSEPAPAATTRTRRRVKRAQ